MKKMSTWLSSNSFKKNDELYTPKIMVKPILKFLRPKSVIWCPFDTKYSEFVITFQEEGHKVIHSHTWFGKDFFTFEPEEPYDYIISNPPFSRKLEVLDRLYRIGKPFGMILGLPILNYQEIGTFFLDKDLQLLIFNKKVSFNGNTASFNTAYFCSDLLPNKIIFESLENNNSNKHFKPSTMLIIKSRVDKMRNIIRAS
jgi:hypothetical protein